MIQLDIVTVAGACFIAGALAFTGVFTWLAARFDYPRVLDGEAAEVLPRLRSGGATMRAVWAVYAFLPLLLVPAAIGAAHAMPSSPGRMILALVLASVGVLAMCLGLMRWPSIHWELARAWETAGPEARQGMGATFRGLNLYLGNYIGEFLGELCLGAFFLLTGLATLDEPRFPAWLGWGGVAFGLSFIIGAFRNVTARAAWISSLNNLLLPVWMIVLGGALIWCRQG